MQSMRSEITNFQSGLGSETLLDRAAPLLDVLSRSIKFKRGKADRGRAQHGRRKVEMTIENAGRRNEIIALLRLRKNIGDIVPLVAPGIHVYRSKENPEGAVGNDPQARHMVREAKPRREF